MKSPTWLSTNAKRLFTEMAKEIDVNKRNKHSLALLCDSFTTYRDAKKKVDEEGITTVAGTGAIKAHPLLTSMHQAFDRYMKLAKELGLHEAAADIDEIEALLDEE